MRLLALSTRTLCDAHIVMIALLNMNCLRDPTIAFFFFDLVCSSDNFKKVEEPGLFQRTFMAICEKYIEEQCY